MHTLAKAPYAADAIAAALVEREALGARDA